MDLTNMVNSLKDKYGVLKDNLRDFLVSDGLKKGTYVLMLIGGTAIISPLYSSSLKDKPKIEQHRSIEGITEEEARQIDIQNAEDFGLYPNVVLDDTVFLYTINNHELRVKTALMIANDTISGSQLTGYFWKSNLTPEEITAIQDSMPNTCLRIFDISNDTTTLENYTQGTRDALEECGYIVTGEKENKKIDSKIKVYPNPLIEGSLTFEADDNTKITWAGIYNMQGQKVFEKDLINKPNRTLRLNMDKFSEGMYITRILDNEGNLYFQKIIKQ